MLKYILFDFDGTLVDSRNVFVSVFNRLAEKHRFNKIEPDNIEYLRSLSMKQRFTYLRVPFYKLPFLTPEFLSLYALEVKKLSLVEGMRSVFDALEKKGLKIGIISSNSVNTIRSFLDHNAIRNIPEVHCSGKLFGKEKLLQKFLRTQKLQAHEVLYVCDELRDIVACGKVNIQPIWVSWGFEPKEVFTTHEHVLCANTPQELLNIIENFEPTISI